MGIRAVEVKPKTKGAGAPPEGKPMAEPSLQREEGVIATRLCRYVDGEQTSEVSEEFRILVPRFPGEVARTRVSLGCTRSLGGYEFARIDVMVEMPCNPHPRDLDETNAFASAKATEYMERELASLDAVAEPRYVAPTQQLTDTRAFDNAD